MKELTDAALLDWVSTWYLDVPESPDLGSILADLQQALANGSSCVPLGDRSLPKELAGSGDGGELLTVHGDRIGFSRLAFNEREIARQVRLRTQAPAATDDNALSRVQAAAKVLKLRIDATQTEAAATAISGALGLIAGPPGSGKTTIVAALLKAWAETRAISEPQEVALLAPTGRAASRLAESLQPHAAQLPPFQHQTLHRFCNRRIEHPLAARRRTFPPGIGLVVVDEVSMASVDLLYQLFTYVPPDRPIILIGDEAQLASIDAGSVFADLVETATKVPSLATQTARLTRIYRYATDSRLGKASGAIRNLDFAELESLLTEAADSDLQRRDRLSPHHGWASRDLADWIESLNAPAEVAEALPLVASYRLLAAQRVGSGGVDNLNRRSLDRATAAGFHRIPIMITENRPGLGLSNGDTGLLGSSLEGDRQAWFGDRDSGIRSYPVAALPRWEPAFATTIHKAQGSEFDKIELLIPAQPPDWLDRRLLYTGLTRARQSARILGRIPDILAVAQCQTERGTFLRDYLERDLRT